MKTPASITGIFGSVVAMLCLAGPVAARSDAAAPTAKASPTPSAPIVTIRPDVASETAPASTTPRLSPWTKEIVKLAQAGIEESVLLPFIENSGTFELGAEQIIYLTDIGVPASVIGAMLQHDRELVSGERLLTITSDPPYEPLFPTKPANRGKPTGEAVKPANVAPVSAATASVIGDPGRKTPPVPGEVAAARVLSAHEPVTPTSAFKPVREQRETAKKKPLYPVREPHPVELLPPIIFLNVQEIEPNTLIVYGFPKS